MPRPKKITTTKITCSNELVELVRRRRAQMLVHSCIYYELNESIISDHQWQAWADELQKLQEEHPSCLRIDFYDWEFRDWEVLLEHTYHIGTLGFSKRQIIF